VPLKLETLFGHVHNPQFTDFPTPLFNISHEVLPREIEEAIMPLSIFEGKRQGKRTIATALRGTDGIVVATDSGILMTAGDIRCHSDEGKKITALRDSMALMSVGSFAEFTAFLELFFKDKTLTAEVMRDEVDDLVQVTRRLSEYSSRFRSAVSRLVTSRSRSHTS